MWLREGRLLEPEPADPATFGRSQSDTVLFIFMEETEDDCKASKRLRQEYRVSSMSTMRACWERIHSVVRVAALANSRNCLCTPAMLLAEKTSHSDGFADEVLQCRASAGWRAGANEAIASARETSNSPVRDHGVSAKWGQTI